MLVGGARRPLPVGGKITLPSRKDSFGYGVTIPATSARVVDTALEILGDPDPGELAFLRSVLT